ncbi:MAG: hypothetical protein DRR16_26060 [Candidatus Parabeggiatoa sp. nov. 3]|nr:MAG: hypothetical protein DRR00_14850 [Gammaproteobacteria bacterium]RKZ60044.1 MAG: hypothetical protein DRQ99_22780 [Gammaproteobacteria bacterium]RKZ79263.1 MAG: hypothetical protein DRR16_26060 [Gammaproteobacteria bacterium]
MLGEFVRYFMNFILRRPFGVQNLFCFGALECKILRRHNFMRRFHMSESDCNKKNGATYSFFPNLLFWLIFPSIGVKSNDIRFS